MITMAMIAKIKRMYFREKLSISEIVQRWRALNPDANTYYGVKAVATSLLRQTERWLMW